MRVSVIIPVRNGTSTLNRALESVFAQTFQPFEVLVADDLSTDELWKTTEKYNVKVLHHMGPEPWGPAGGRNAAFAYSKGEAILPLDADDWLEPRYLEMTIPLMTPGVGVVSTNMVYHGESEGSIVISNPQTYREELLQNNIPITSLIRREALNEVGPWDDNLRGWEDWDIWVRILKRGWRHVTLNENLFHYTLHKSGVNQWADNHKEELKQKFRRKHGV